MNSRETKRTILVVEDDLSIAGFISNVLQANHYLTETAGTGVEAKSILASRNPDLVLLDLGLPDIDGMEVLRWLREWSGIPVIILSARGHEEDKVTALDLGADDYITKPFGNHELLARIRAALRHWDSSSASDQGGVIRIKDLTVDTEKRRITVGDKEVKLTANEYKIVSILAKNPGKVLTYDVLIREIWGPFAGSDNRILRVNMANIRRKLGENSANPKYISTELGVGYRMLEE